MPNQETTLTRDHLHEMVWSEPTRTVAARFGLSDRGLAKICIRLHVPLPGRGYWQKKSAGHEVHRAPLRPLPPSASADEREVQVGGESAPRRDPAVLAAAQLQASLEKVPERVVHVSATLDNPHPLVERAARSLRRSRRDQRGVLVPDAQRVLDIRVTRGTLERALLIADALVKALQERGYPVSCVGEGERRTIVRVSEEDITFTFEEKIRRVEKEPEPRSKRTPTSYSPSTWPEYEYVPTGNLAIKLTDQDFANSRRTWQDTSTHRLETQLNRFIVGLVATAEVKKIERQQQEERRRQWEEHRRQEEEQQRRRFEEERKVRLLNGRPGGTR